MGERPPYATYAVSATAAYVVYRLIKSLATPNPLANLRGPPNPSLLLGHNFTFREAIKSDSIYDIIEDWVEEYGSVVGFRDLLNVTMTLLDPYGELFD
jgi:hypothetical protein